MAKYSIYDRISSTYPPFMGRTLGWIYDQSEHDMYLMNLVLSGELELDGPRMEEIERGSQIELYKGLVIKDPDEYEI